jgi:hypothetical protein
MENMTSAQLAQLLYVAYYGRPADSAGQQFWADQIDAVGVAGVAADFGASAEFDARFGEMSNEELVQNLYQQLFSRDGETAGVEYWTNVLNEGASLAQIAYEIANGAQGADVTARDNKVSVSQQFTDLAGDAYAGDDAASSARDFVMTINADTDVETVDVQAAVDALSEAPASDLTEALAAYEATVEAQTAAEVAYSEAVVEAGLIADTDANDDGIADAFNSTTDYVAQAEASVQTATADLATARAGAPDSEINTAVTQAQAAVNAYTANRYNEDGVVATSGTTYSLAQLQARAVNAQAAFEADVAADGETSVLAQDLEDAIALYTSAGNTAPAALATLSTAIDEYQAGTSTEADLLDASASAFTALNVEEDGSDSDLDDVERADAIENLLVTLNQRNGLADTAVENQTAFEAAEDLAVAAFADVDFVGADTDLTSALATQETREDLIDTLETAQENLSAIEAATTAFAEAEQAVADAAEELGYDIQNIDSSSLLATEESDLFIFDAEEAEDAGITDVAINGFESADLLFLGSDYSVGTEGSADNNALEVFITETNGNAVLQIENSAFGSASDDFTEITLTGVASADVSIEAGVVSIA